MTVLTIISLTMLLVLLIVFLFVKENMILDFAVVVASSLACASVISYLILNKGR